MNLAYRELGALLVTNRAGLTERRGLHVSVGRRIYSIVTAKAG